MRPTAHTQQASSRAVATFALLLWTPRASRVPRLSTSLRTPLAACLRAPGVVAVVLPAPVRAGLDHLRDGADHAVDPEAGEPLLQVEPRDPGLVHAPGPGVHGPHPLRDCPGVVAEGRAAHLPGHDVEGDCLYRAGVDVEADEGGSIEHGSPFHECGVAAAAELDTHHCRPNPRSFMQQGLSMFLCPAHIVSAGSWGQSLF